MSAPVQGVLDRLHGVKAAGSGKWTALCPVHEADGNGHRPSLSIGQGDDGRVLLNCMAGCATGDVVKALGLTMADLFLDRPKTDAPQATTRRIVKTYDYLDETGALLFQSVRYEPKDFRQRRPDGHGHYVWGLSEGDYVQGANGDWYKPNERTPPTATRKHFAEVRRVLYRLPELLAADKSAWVFVVEGEKDADNLAALGLVATTNPGGAGKWRLEYSESLRGRRVATLWDKDPPDKKGEIKGLKHARDMARSLHVKAADVRIVNLSDVAGATVKDITDWLEAQDAQTQVDLAAALVALAEAAPTWAPPVETPAAQPAPVAARGTDGLIKRLADAIGAEHQFARDTGGRLCVFGEGVFRPHGEQAVKAAVKRLLIAWGESAAWSAHRAEEAAEYIRVDAPPLWERPPADTMNLVNGLVDVNSRTLRPHDPAFLSPVQLPVVYDPAATCPEWERFIAATFPPDALGLPWELAAWLMLPDTSIQKAVLLLGEGANGKSTFLAALAAFIGKRNIAGLSLQKLESDRFAVARLVGKLANVCPDLPSAHLSGTSVFKALTGGDVLLAERKYADSFEFSPFARLIFSANHPPRSHDASHAFFRRWLVVPFCRTFSPDEQIPRNILDARLADPKELSGVLNRALDALPGLRAKGFTESQSMRDAWNEFRETTDPVAVWLDDHTVQGPDVLVTKRDLLAAYNTVARHEQRLSLTPMSFGQALKRLRPDIQEAQRTIGGALAWVWVGIGLAAERPPAG